MFINRKVNNKAQFGRGGILMADDELDDDDEDEAWDEEDDFDEDEDGE